MWEQKAEDDKQRIEYCAQQECDDQIIVTGADVAGQDGGHDQCRITDVHDDRGEFLRSQAVYDAAFMKIYADGDQQEDHAHLLEQDR